MYEDLGIHWASSLPAFLAAACVPFPFLFYRYGAPIRAKCRYASEAAGVLQAMRSKQQQHHQSEEQGESNDFMAEIEMERTRSNAHPN
jgi:hypothetical protein